MEPVTDTTPEDAWAEDPAFRVILDLEGGDSLEVDAFHSEAEAEACARELERKRDAYRAAFGDRKALFLTLITTYGVRANDHAQRLGIRPLTMDALFD